MSPHVTVILISEYHQVFTRHILSSISSYHGEFPWLSYQRIASSHVDPRLVMFHPRDCWPIFSHFHMQSTFFLSCDSNEHSYRLLEIFVSPFHYEISVYPSYVLYSLSLFQIVPFKIQIQHSLDFPWYSENSNGPNASWWWGKFILIYNYSGNVRSGPRPSYSTGNSCFCPTKHLLAIFCVYFAKTSTLVHSFLVGI